MVVGPTPYSMEISDKRQMIMFTHEPNIEGCLNFYNQSWICFEDVVQKAMLDADSLIEINEKVEVYGCQYDAPWHLHSISRLTTPPPSIYQFDEPSPATLVYVIDSWIDTNHFEFQGRARMGATFATGTNNGHGTHVAGLIGSKTYGVNKNAQIVGVQVLDDSGTASWQRIITGMEWVAKQPVKGIVNLSIGGGKSEIVNRVVRLMVSNGWKVVVAAGNDAKDACYTSPGSTTEALTVAASNSQNKFSGFSNYGSCVDIIAPGEGVLSLWPGNRLAWMSGTSMAAPIVSGVWSTHPEWSMKDILDNARKNVIEALPNYTPNTFLFKPVALPCAA